ncbi:MAG: UDP-N-acetylglucosamine 2-epimerase (non-hydrolyzing) [Candidatus Rokubacteria bacterium]|nr:UDP-N-acetylglucosamine 2-epimerase (non-hydrolyzing) [Candidatus Rokubacteria bacterium]
MKLVSIVGARPQFIKIAPLLRSFEHFTRRGGPPIDHIIVHTGQHYDAGMSDVFFDELAIPPATFNLGVGSGSHGSQTDQMLARIEGALLNGRPDIVVTYGDTNSTLAATLSAAKLHIPVAHVEAGLRSFNRRMPEEINRVVADHVSDLLLAPTPTAIANLEKEGLAERAVLTGDIMYDAVLFNRRLAAQRSSILDRLALEPRRYGVVTIHRAENTDDEKRLRKVLSALNEIAATAARLVFPLHPRTAKVLQSRFPAWSPHPRLQLIPPAGYLDTLSLVGHARMLLTDSGGLQKEAFFLGCPCITLREETEWVETLQGGGNILAGIEPEAIRAAVSAWEARAPAGQADFSAAAAAAFGDGHAADRIRDAVLAFIAPRERASHALL